MMIRDKKLGKIKEEVLDYALDLWGLDDETKLDPVVGLLLDAFAYESYKLRGEIEKSDDQLLKRLSRILIGQRWYLPFPAHGLMTVHPQDGEYSVLLSPEDHFFIEKVRQGDRREQVFFTPLSHHPLIDARIVNVLWGTQIQVSHRRRSEQFRFLSDLQRLEDHTVWLGIHISSAQLSKLDRLPLCFLPEEAHLAFLLRDTLIYDVSDNLLSLEPYTLQHENDEDHYAQEINAYYKDYFYQVELPSDATMHSLRNLFPDGDLDQNLDGDAKYFWLKIVLPPAFNRDSIESLGIHINTFPVVNRKMERSHHSFHAGGRILPLACSRSAYFLNVHSLIDNDGCYYSNRLKHYEEQPDGTFSLYFGELERFDAADAQTQIAKVLQLIREEGNAFAAINPEGVSTQLKELFEKLEAVEKGTYRMRESVERIKAFLLTVPITGATHAELKYWQCQGEEGNDVTPRSTVLQFNMDKYNPSGIRFQTTTHQGRLNEGEYDLIQSLRYGLLSRERIVSREDVRSYINHRMGSHITAVDIKDGITISQDLRKGIVRTTEVHIQLNKTSLSSSQYQDNLSRIAHFIEGELEHRSVSHTTYKVYFL